MTLSWFSASNVKSPFIVAFPHSFYHFQLSYSPRQYLPVMPHTFTPKAFRILLVLLTSFPPSKTSFQLSVTPEFFGTSPLNNVILCLGWSAQLSYTFQEGIDHLSIIFAPHYLKNTALQRGNSLNTGLIGIRVSCAAIFSNNPYESYGFLAG